MVAEDASQDNGGQTEQRTVIKGKKRNSSLCDMNIVLHIFCNEECSYHWNNSRLKYHLSAKHEVENFTKARDSAATEATASICIVEPYFVTKPV